jgi:hypothetical protein
MSQRNRNCWFRQERWGDRPEREVEHPRRALSRDGVNSRPGRVAGGDSRPDVPVAAVRGFLEEGLQVLADDGVEHGVLRVAGLIRALRIGRALAQRVPRATPMPRDGHTVSVLEGAPGCRWSATATSQRPSGLESSGLCGLRVLVASCS